MPTRWRFKAVSSKPALTVAMPRAHGRAMSSNKQLEEGSLFAPRFDRDGLIPAVTVDHGSGEVLMVAWMNAAALDATLRTRVVHYWSRSRG